MDAIKFDLARTIPANPGFFVLTTLDDDSGRPEGVDQRPVVAWAFEVDSLVPFPVALDGVQTHNAYILQPHGTVEGIRDIGGFASVAEWFKTQQADHDNKQRRAK